MPLRQPKVRSELEYFDQVVEGEEVVMVRDPIRGTYYKFNPLQAAMLKNLDGVRTLDQMVATLSDEFEVEIPRHAAERFVAQARKMMLLDVASYNVSEAAAQKKVLKTLDRAGFKFRTPRPDADGHARVVSAEAVLFMGGLRHLQNGHPAKALDYFCAVLELNPNNKRSRELFNAIQSGYIKALSGSSDDLPTIATFNPTRILKLLDRTIGKLVFHWVAAFALLALVVVSIYCYATTTYPDFEVGVLDVTLAYVLIIGHVFLHEFGHGLACYHFGGRVTEIGLAVFYYVAAVPYCDTSSTYLFQDRSRKVWVSLAGNVVTLVLTCLSIITLAVVRTDIFFYRAVQIHLLGSLVALVSNFIPFMKFDGYYALCDLVGTPNLRERSFKLLKTWCGTRLLGLPAAAEDLEPGKRRLFVAFGVLSLLFTIDWIYQGVWRFTAPVVERYQGAGLVIMVLIMGYLLRGALFRPFKNLIALCVRERRQIFTLKRTAFMVLLLGIAIAPWAIQWPILVDADFVVQPKERSDARAEMSGVVRDVLVREGDVVHRGQPLATLSAPDVDLKILVMQSELARIDAQLDELRSGASLEEIQVARTQTATALSTEYKQHREAEQAATLANAGIGTLALADETAGTAAVSRSMASAAQWKLATLQAGSRKEVIAATEADRSRLVSQLDRAKADHELLTIRSPIDGIVVSNHLEDRRSARLDRGDTFAQIQDLSAFVAEIRLSASAPLGEISVGDEIALRADGVPGGAIRCRVERIRDQAIASDGEVNRDGHERDLIVMTTPFAVAKLRSGMTGHARIYGRRRSLAYAKLYLPLERVGVSLWSIM